jgi:hypothetical protein
MQRVFECESVVFYGAAARLRRPMRAQPPGRTPKKPRPQNGIQMVLEKAPYQRQGARKKGVSLLRA